MEKKEFAFKGTVVNGFAMLSLTLALLLCGIASAIYGFAQVDNNANGGLIVGLGVALIVCMICVMCGFVKIEPNEARVMVFFGQYKGTFTTVGFHWVNPFISTKRLSFRARNIDAAPIKVNDKTGNPVLIGMMLVWRLRDTLRHVAGQYAYDNTDDDKTAQTLRDNSEEINKLLEQTLDERLDMAGIEIIEARINYLAYAPEIAAVMLRRQQASAIISAREKIVEGAVSMVDMALKKLDKENVVALDDDKKAAMVSNLMVVLCSENATQPVVNSGTLNM